MSILSDNYTANYNAMSASTKGAAPAMHIMWSAVILTIFESIEAWVLSNPVKRFQKELGHDNTNPSH